MLRTAPSCVGSPHGVIDRRLLERPKLDELLRYAAFGARITSTWMWFPGPEPSTITRGFDYDLLSVFETTETFPTYRFRSAVS